MELCLHSSIHAFGYPKNFLKSYILSTADEDKAMLPVLLKLLRLDDTETETRHRQGNFSPPRNVQKVSVADPASYSLGTVFFSEVKESMELYLYSVYYLHLVKRDKFTLKLHVNPLYVLLFDPRS